MIFNDFDIKTFIWRVGSVYCTIDESNPTPVYVLEDADDVLQCGFESSSLEWFVYNGGKWNILASKGDVIDDSKYSVSKNPSTGLYYRLHILNVGVSDVNMHRCVGNVNRRIELFYLMLYFLGRCDYILGIFKVGQIIYSCS